MFMLYALVLGVVIGLLAGGRPSGLARVEFRWSWLILAGLVGQIVLFSDQVASVVGDLGPPIYVGSTAAVFAGVLRNVRLTGMPVVALGAACNLAAVAANGGFMPASREALAALGTSEATIYSNSAVVANPALAPLTDIFALPRWLPFANIFSIGDVLLALGVTIVVVAAMRSRAPDDHTEAHGTAPLPT